MFNIILTIICEIIDFTEKCLKLVFFCTYENRIGTRLYKVDDLIILFRHI